MKSACTIKFGKMVISVSFIGVRLSLLLGHSAYPPEQKPCSFHAGICEHG